MNVQEALDTLKSLGTEQASVSYADLKNLKKKVKTDHDLAAGYEMNGALIAIGIRNPALEKKAIAAAERIGKVEVDHGETGCKTPDAVPYIRQAVERRKK